MWFGFIPITSEGRLTQISMATGFFGFGLLSFAFDRDSALNWLFIVLAFISAVTGYAIVISKTESEF